MPILTKEQFEDLAKFDNNPCISIFIPTERAGKDVLEGKGRIHLKSQWKKAAEKLKEMGLDQDKISKIGKPVEDLLADSDFWRHQSDGLALFLADGFFRKYTLPVYFEEYTYVSDHFYLKPLVPMFSGDGRFYLLALQMDRVQLYEGNRYSVGEVDVEDLTPSQLEERVGFDYEEKNLKSKTQNETTGTTVTHGYGAAERDRKNEFLRFFRAVDKGLHEVLKDEKVPLVVACQDYLFPIYQEASTYKRLFPEPVPGNPSDYENMLALHSAALEVLKPHFDKEKEEKMKQFKEMNPGRTSVMVSEIIPAIYQGKVDTLFLQNREDIWGNYNENMASVDVQDGPSSANTSLMNLAAVKVIEQGGNVYLIENEFMPDNSSKMNAVFRY
ncbi:baeRF3 domain-containing protein [Salinimicrobium soli]|uniref:baeRF3 domain-containing protein n=1 Tax=Salinimicrobium soli TaxID=1254399 RepID=UPI003AAB8416